MDAEKRLTQMRTDLAALEMRIEQVSSQTRGVQPSQSGEPASVPCEWFDSAAWILLAGGWC